MSKNGHVISALTTLTVTKNPDAILVRGAWGSGKTHLVKNALKSSNPLYVSLFGASNSEDVKLRILAAAYPVLTSGSVKVLGSLARSALGVVRFKSDLTAQNLLDAPTDKVIIFDDLERCGIDDKTMLGLINDFVEHDTCRVVAIINDENPKSCDFESYKEKVFSFTVSVEADFGAVYGTIYDGENKSYSVFLKLAEESIIQTFEKLDSQNLRTLRFSIKNFELWYDKLSASLSDGIILDVFLVFSACVISST